ncbi:response regulator transcription factor [Ferdinandcohnia sp. Marseille-Q9671]
MKINLLLAEDEGNVRRGITQFIQSLGEPYCLVGSAANGLEAIELARQTNIHILLTDIRMPQMDGLDLVKQVKLLHPECKIIIVSGYDDFEYARKAIQLGVQEFLLKPIQQENLSETLSKVTSMYFSLSTHNQLMVNQEKWDMTLVRLESTLFDAIEIGNKNASREAFTKLYLAFLSRVEDDPFRLLSFVIDSLKSLRKRLSSNELIQTFFRKEGIKLFEELNPKMTTQAIRTSVEEFVVQCSNIVRDSRQQSCPDILFHCKEVINNHYKQSITLNEVANIVGVTPSYLSRVFKKEVGINFIDYLNKVRIEKAKKLLGDSEMKVLEVSEKVGFNSTEYFTRIFKKHTGVSPLYFRTKSVENK